MSETNITLPYSQIVAVPTVADHQLQKFSVQRGDSAGHVLPIIEVVLAVEESGTYVPQSTKVLHVTSEAAQNCRTLLLYAVYPHPAEVPEVYRADYAAALAAIDSAVAAAHTDDPIACPVDTVVGMTFRDAGKLILDIFGEPFIGF